MPSLVYWYSRHLFSIDWEDLCWIALCYANIFGVVVFNASMLDWLGGIQCSGCSSMQGIYAQLTGEDLCLIALCYANIFGVVAFNASMFNWLGASICLLYICIVLDLAVGVAVCKESVLDWLGGSICLLYICIVLDLAVGVAVCKASVLVWLGDPSAFYIYALS